MKEVEKHVFNQLYNEQLWIVAAEYGVIWDKLAEQATLKVQSIVEESNHFTPGPPYRHS